MASRLYRTTRQLYLAVEAALLRLHLNRLGTPTLAALIALAVTGLILLDARPTQTRVARGLPAHCHDALNRLLREMSWSTRALTTLMAYPVGFRLWWPKRSYHKQRYQTKLQLAADLVVVVVRTGLIVQSVVRDTHYTAGWFTKRLRRLGVIWHGTRNPKATVVWRGRKLAVRDLAGRLHLKWRQQLGLRALALQAYAPKYGHLRLVV